MSKDNSFTLINVKKIINNTPILEETSISFKKKQVIVIMGLSGSGKTTFLNILSGLDKPSSGSVIIEGTDITKLKEPKLTKFRSLNIAYIFQEYNLIDYLNIKENILINSTLNKIKIDNKKYEQIIKSLDLIKLEKQNITSLSGGEQQRVAIARALIGNNQIIFADEPTGALDIKSSENVIDLLIENALAFEKTLFIVTHDPNVALKADQIILIKDKKLKLLEKNIDKKILESYLKN
ncbi:ABC transporter ATP-binding protein [Spiroplasma gladiatoris]|uniref:ABC transporter ATP-binding protein n=1 Tax=Spiroplasma gladiatoris TaxID=2143 RepID=A0A4P7AHC4_9MOLU|nr:ABC transporter ATP-binding protein [Spiroplasma gladiatoris]QBQ07854.1 ABC transporter ATP-binding protein [Spiroplasma gladiatoris]